MKRSSLMVNIGFLLVIAAVLFGGLGKTVFRPKEVNLYENRPAHQIGELSLSAFADGSFQASMEDALSDQLPLAQTMKKRYNDWNNQFVLSKLSDFMKSHPDRYIVFFDMLTFGGENIVYRPRNLADVSGFIDARVDNMNTLMAQNPNVEYFTYFIEKDTDLNFETGEKIGAYEYVLDRLEMDKSHIARFEINDFETFREYFYRTDHHWNYKGSYQGYREVAELLGVDELLTPAEEIDTGYILSGSKSAAIGGAKYFKEPFSAYRFDFPAMDITIDGEPAEDYGNQDAYFAGSPEGVAYGLFYGSDCAEIVFDTHQADKRNILILGESFDNAILKLLAPGFHKLYSVDLRANEDFVFSDYLREHEIDTVLFIGNLDYFVSEDFLMEE